MAEADDLRQAMGKKIPAIMAKHRLRFMRGAKENGIPSDKAKNIFDLMEKFGGYGFNKSHSAAYALIAFQTAYLKAHYPVEFMAALLSSEMHSSDSVVKYIAECRSHDIPILPPDINESDKEFTVQDKGIRCGLVAVKNVGESAIESIIEARQEGKFTSLFDFCERVDLRRVNKRVVESLIKCGAFDSTGTYRSRMMASLEDALEYGQRVQKEKSDPQMGLFDMGGDKPVMINYPPMAEIDEWDERQLLALEKESLGFYITGHPLSGHEDLLEKFTNADTLSIKERKDGETVRIGGIIRSVKTIRTKKGDLMAFAAVEDLQGSIEATVFPSTYAASHDLLGEDTAVLIQGQVQKDENAVKILADSIIAINKAEETWTAVIHLNLDMQRTQRDTLKKLHDILKRHPGFCQAYIHLRNQEETDVVIALPETMMVAAGVSLNRKIKDLLGYDAVETVCRVASSDKTVNNASGNNKKGNFQHV
jgi:DNA polymerase-3 subunit alpha